MSGFPQFHGPLGTLARAQMASVNLQNAIYHNASQGFGSLGDMYLNAAPRKPESEIDRRIRLAGDRVTALEKILVARFSETQGAGE